MIRDNWVSLPPGNPFVGKRLQDFCDTNGDGIATTLDTVAFVAEPGRIVSGAGSSLVVDPSAVIFTVTHSCAVAASSNSLYRPGSPVRLRAKTSRIPAGDVQLVLDGWDVPGPEVLVYNASTCGGTCPGSVCDNWVDLLYHTTALRLRDVCDTNGDGLVQAATDAFIIVSQQRRRLTSTSSDPRFLDSVVTHGCDLRCPTTPSSSSPARSA